jgi:hypothetical protein
MHQELMESPQNATLLRQQISCHFEASAAQVTFADGASLRV